MAAGSEVIQEYLVSLGFKTDSISLSKFEGALGAVGGKILKIGTAVAGVAGAIETAAAGFAYSMRKTYFASELAGSTVKNLNAMKFAGEQIGISSDSMAESLQSFAMSMRMNPGLQGVLESFGVKVQGRDISDVATDFVAATKNMPLYAGAQYAQMFGMDQETYYRMTQHAGAFQAYREENLAMQGKAGYNPDTDVNRRRIMDYTHDIDALKSRTDIMAQNLTLHAAPALDKFTLLLKTAENNAADLATKIAGLIPGFKALDESVTSPRNLRNNNPGNIEYGGFAQRHGAIGSDGRFAVFPDLATGMQAEQLLVGVKGKMGYDTLQSLINNLTPPGENDTDRYIRDVSSRLGMNPTEKFDWKDRNTRMNIARAIAQEEGMPKAYLGNTPGVTATPVIVNQSNTFNVTGANAKAISDSVVNNLQRVNGDIVRNMKSRVQ